jgi:hypothetical protein
MRLMDDMAGEEGLRGTGTSLQMFGSVVDTRIVDVRVRGDSARSGGGLEGTFSGSRNLSPVRNLERPPMGMAGSRQRDRVLRDLGENGGLSTVET